MSATLFKKRLHRCFPVNFQEHLFSQNASGRCFFMKNCWKTEAYLELLDAATGVVLSKKVFL